MKVGERVIYKYLPGERTLEGRRSPPPEGTIVGGPQIVWPPGTSKSWAQYEILWDGRQDSGWWDEKRLKVVIKAANIYDQLEVMLNDNLSV
jgi:hypothetical protein|tara:strand:- start:905 stop:1177 length:273 start_codon:yes stop_codon:yes gene_type:complete